MCRLDLDLPRNHNQKHCGGLEDDGYMLISVKTEGVGQMCGSLMIYACECLVPVSVWNLCSLEMTLEIQPNDDEEISLWYSSLNEFLSHTCFSVYKSETWLLRETGHI